MAEIALKAPPPPEALARSGREAEGSAETAPSDPAGSAPRWYYPYLVVVHAEGDGVYIWKEDAEGDRVREKVSVEELEAMVRAGARVRIVGFREGDRKNIQFGERGSVPKGERAPAFDDATREAIFARDGRRCVGCETDKDLQACHWDARAEGGANDVRNGYTGCGACHALDHEGLLSLSAEGGKITAVDREGKPLRRAVSAEEALSASAEDERAGERELTVIEREEASGAREGESPDADPDRPFSVEELPEEVDARTWRELEGHFDWSESRGAYVARPERGRPRLGGSSEAERGKDAQSGSAPEAQPSGQSPAEAQPAPSSPAASSPEAQPSGQSPAEAQPAPSSPAASSPEAQAGAQAEKASDPSALSEFVGQKRIVENLKLNAQCARAEGKAAGHVLLYGAPGLGKSTLGAIVAREIGSKLTSSLGVSLEPRGLLSLLAELEHGDVFFIDEIHGLSGKCQELLYSALQEGFLETLVADPTSARVRTLRIRLEPFTLVAATTAPGALSESLRGRFALIERLENYTEGEIVEIVCRAARRGGYALDRAGALEIARVARGVPREALRILGQARKLAVVAGRTMITDDDVETARRMFALDEAGLTKEERSIVDLLLDRGKPTGIEAIAELLGMDANVIRALHEPWLLRAGFIDRTERGRVATERARVATERGRVATERGRELRERARNSGNGAAVARANGSESKAGPAKAIWRLPPERSG